MRGRHHEEERVVWQGLEILLVSDLCVVFHQDKSYVIPSIGELLPGLLQQLLERSGDNPLPLLGEASTDLVRPGPAGVVRLGLTKQEAQSLEARWEVFSKNFFGFSLKILCYEVKGDM